MKKYAIVFFLSLLLASPLFGQPASTYTDSGGKYAYFGPEGQVSIWAINNSSLTIIKGKAVKASTDTVILGSLDSTRAGADGVVFIKGGEADTAG